MIVLSAAKKVNIRIDSFHVILIFYHHLDIFSKRKLESIRIESPKRRLILTWT